MSSRSPTSPGPDSPTSSSPLDTAFQGLEHLLLRPQHPIRVVAILTPPIPRNSVVVANVGVQLVGHLTQSDFRQFFSPVPDISFTRLPAIVVQRPDDNSTQLSVKIVPADLTRLVGAPAHALFLIRVDFLIFSEFLPDERIANAQIHFHARILSRFGSTAESSSSSKSRRVEEYSAFSRWIRSTSSSVGTSRSVRALIDRGLEGKPDEEEEEGETEERDLPCDLFLYYDCHRDHFFLSRSQYLDHLLLIPWMTEEKETLLMLDDVDPSLLHAADGIHVHPIGENCDECERASLEFLVTGGHVRSNRVVQFDLVNASDTSHIILQYVFFLKPNSTSLMVGNRLCEKGFSPLCLRPLTQLRLVLKKYSAHYGLKGLIGLQVKNGEMIQNVDLLFFTTYDGVRAGVSMNPFDTRLDSERAAFNRYFEDKRNWIELGTKQVLSVSDTIENGEMIAVVPIHASLCTPKKKRFWAHLKFELRKTRPTRIIS